MEPLASFISDFADQAVILPVAAITATGLALSGWRRAATVWSLALVAVLGVVLLAKLGFAAASDRPVWGVHSPSGHAGAAAAAYGGFAALAARAMRKGIGWTAAASVAVAAAFSATRLILGVHTPAEVALGSAVGIAGALAIHRWCGDPPEGAHPGRVARAVCVAALLAHGLRMPAEGVIADAAKSLLRPILATGL